MLLFILSDRIRFIRQDFLSFDRYHLEIGSKWTFEIKSRWEKKIEKLISFFLSLSLFYLIDKESLEIHKIAFFHLPSFPHKYFSVNRQSECVIFTSFSLNYLYLTDKYRHFCLQTQISGFIQLKKHTARAMISHAYAVIVLVENQQEILIESMKSSVDSFWNTIGFNSKKVNDCM